MTPEQRESVLALAQDLPAPLEGAGHPGQRPKTCVCSSRTSRSRRFSSRRS
jgi:hypothetical protein